MKHLAKQFACAAVLLAGMLSLLAAPSRAADAEQRVYEMRIYYAAEGKLDALNSRFRDHTVKLFEKHGITNVGYWMPIDNPERMLIYMLSYPSREAREASWKAFGADPEWQKARKESEANGKLVDKVEQTFLEPTDYSPEIKPSTKGDRVFEMRTYTAAPDRLDALNARFRDHTLKLFEKHGMTNIGYWTPMRDQKGAGNTLIYILAHPSREAAKESFAAMGKDPQWQKALKESEEKAGGPLTIKGGVKSVFMKATDYSPIR
ncbi:MAG: NIPSNAP family protein [Aureliella sp.]